MKILSGTPLTDKHIAILATDGFEQSELEEPLKAPREAGATVSIVSPKKGQIQGMRHAEEGDLFDVDLLLRHAHEQDFDALVLPGGLMNPDELRSTPEAVAWVREFGRAGKPIGGIWLDEEVVVDHGIVTSRKPADIPAFNAKVIEEICEGIHER
jgi:protease I